MECLSVFGRAHTQCAMRAKKARTRRLAAQICGARVGPLKSENHIPVPEAPAWATFTLFNEIERPRCEDLRSSMRPCEP